MFWVKGLPLIGEVTVWSIMITMVDDLVNSNKPQTNPDGLVGAVGAPSQARRRMSVAERERHIVDGAIAFFAEHGFDAQMRDLAKAIGVTHTLVYHYFPTKQALVDRVYAEVFEGRWKPEWETLLDQRNVSVPDKLTRFYVDYARTVLTREFVRIIIFSGLTDRSITDRFFSLLQERLFPRLIRETRRHRGSSSRARPTAREHELLLGLHGGIFYGGMRWYVYGQAVHGAQPALDDPATIADRVNGYLAASLALEPGAVPSL
jgi:AcrR family transcriptional regulator